MMLGIWRRCWWVVLFCTMSAFAYSQTVRGKKAAIRDLTFRLGEIEKERRAVLGEKEELLLRIASQSDPSWIEMVLMRELGVVPEGFLKVHFTK